MCEWKIHRVGLKRINESECMCILCATSSLDIFNHLLACARKWNWNIVYFSSKGNSVRYIESQTHVLILFKGAKKRKRERRKKVVRSIGRQWCIELGRNALNGKHVDLNSVTVLHFTSSNIKVWNKAFIASLIFNAKSILFGATFKKNFEW